MSIINNVTGNYVNKAYLKETRGAKKAQPAAAKSPDTSKKTDTVSLSKGLRDIQTAKNAMDSGSELKARAEKVEQLKKSVQNGTYNVSSEKVADKIIDSAINQLV